MSRPLIGVTGPDTAIPVAWWFIAWAIRRGGGRPLRMTPKRPHTQAKLDAVIISGGDDIDPRLYLPDAPDSDRDYARDALELAVIRRALAKNLPLLGICRGAQLLNVALGGSLYGDLRQRRRRTSQRRTPLACKPVAVKSPSRLGDLLGAGRLRVNSLHDQAVARLGDGLRVVARDQDGIVQAIEDRSRRFLIGVQWHPEYLVYQAPQRQLLTALVAAARPT